MLFAAVAFCWLLSAGCWLLAAGCWMLALAAARRLLLVASCWLLATGCWLLAAGWLLDVVCLLMQGGTMLLRQAEGVSKEGSRNSGGGGGVVFGVFGVCGWGGGRCLLVVVAGSVLLWKVGGGWLMCWLPAAGC